MTDVQTARTTEGADLLETLDKHRGFLRYTCQGISDEQAAAKTTVSVLCLGGLIKHVANVEERWMAFMEHGAEAMRQGVEHLNADERMQMWQSMFQIEPGETLAGLLERYEDVARRTDETVAEMTDFDASQALPDAPWFEKGRWSARRVLLHIIAETSQHAGHADIIREAIDDQKTMG